PGCEKCSLGQEQDEDEDHRALAGEFKEARGKEPKSCRQNQAEQQCAKQPAGQEKGYSPRGSAHALAAGAQSRKNGLLFKKRDPQCERPTDQEPSDCQRGGQEKDDTDPCRTPEDRGPYLQVKVDVVLR